MEPTGEVWKAGGEGLPLPRHQHQTINKTKMERETTKLKILPKVPNTDVHNSHKTFTIDGKSKLSDANIVILNLL